MKYKISLYFPALGIYLEIDEGYHSNDNAKILGAKRRFDIADVTGLSEFRISVINITQEEVKSRIDDFINLLKKRRRRWCPQVNLTHGRTMRVIPPNPTLKQGI